MYIWGKRGLAYERYVEIRARTAHACVECEILFEIFSLIFLSTPHLFLVKSMDTYLYINFVDTTGQRTRLYPNKRVLAFVTPSQKILHKRVTITVAALSLAC